MAALWTLPFLLVVCVVFYKAGHEAGVSDGIEKERKRSDESDQLPKSHEGP